MNKLYTVVFTLLSLVVVAQKKHTLSGNVINEKNEAFAFAMLLLTKDSVGEELAVYSDMDGKFKFEVADGEYLLKVNVIGYESYEEKISLTGNVKLKNIQLKLGSTQLDEVEINVERSVMEMKLDKKVYNVAQDPNNQGADASEILENVPSVTLDADGNVQLRGSGNVRILINGKQSGLTSMGSADVLELIQGNMIEQIEVITNPSAKYDAEGTTGIINIILKLKKKDGVDGNLQLNTGIPDNHSALVNLSWQSKKVDWRAAGGIGYRSYPAEGGGKIISKGDTVFTFERERTQNRKGINASLQMGGDIYLDSSNTINFLASYYRRNSPNFAEVIFRDFDPLNEGNLLSTTIRSEDEFEIKENIEFGLGHVKKFKRPDTKWTSDVNWYYNKDIEDADIRQTFGSEELNQRSFNSENEMSLLAQSDLVYPINELAKLETGIRNTYREVLNDYQVDELDNNTWVNFPDFTDVVNYRENVAAAYVQYSSEWERFSLQAGLRNEWSYIEVDQFSVAAPNIKRYNDFFPSVFTAYKLDSTNTIQLNYSKRINRPRFRDLLPFWSFSDPRNQYTGNPDLNPIYIHSYEAAYLKYFKKATVLLSAYYRRENDVVDRITFLDEAAVVRTIPVNLAVQHVYGVEANLNLNFYKWWRANVTLNYFQRDLNGTFKDQFYENQTAVVFLQAQNNFTITKKWSVNVTNFYRSPQTTPQGTFAHIRFMNISSTHQLMDKKAKLTLSLRDVFRERVYERTVDEAFFYSESYFRPRVRMFVVTFNYRFSQKPPKKIETRLKYEDE